MLKYTRNKRYLNTIAASVSQKLKRDEHDAITSRPMYLDAQATTPLDPRVHHDMLPYSVSYYGNPHSASHAYGWHAESAVEIAREQVASIIGANPKEIVFTSGATESNNISVKGIANFYKSR